MAQETTADTFEEATTVDTDVHVTVPNETVAEYLDEPYARYMSTGTGLPSNSWSSWMAGKIPHEPLLTPEGLVARCEEFNIDHPIVNVHTKVTRLPSTDRAVAFARAYNDALADIFLDELDHVHGLINVATQDPAAAAEEVDRWGDNDQIVGAYIVDAGPRTPLGDDRYDVLYRALEDNGMAAVLHSSAGGFVYDFPRQNQSLETYLEVNTLCHPFSHMLHAVSIVCQGVPVKFPDLDFAFLEAGQGWVLTLMYRLNKEYYMRREEAPLLEKSPEKYMREFYYATQPIDEPDDPAHLAQMIEMIGTDSVMFSSDLPHWNFDNPESVERFFAPFSAEEREQMFRGNALEAFDIDL